MEREVQGSMSDTSPMISGIVSAYYAVEYMKQRLDNLAEQGAEAVVVCQRGSGEERIARDYDTTIVLTENIPTIGRAWNLGVEASHGKYLTTANSDDLFRRGALKDIEHVLDVRTDVGLVFGDVYVQEEGKTRRWKRVKAQAGVLRDPMAMLMKQCFVGPMPVWRKSLHNRAGMFNEGLVVVSDYEFWLRLAGTGVKFWYTGCVTGTYAKRKHSLEHRNKLTMLKEAKLVRNLVMA